MGTPVITGVQGGNWNREISVPSARARAQLSKKHTLLGTSQNAYASTGGVTVGVVVSTIDECMMRVLHGKTQRSRIDLELRKNSN